MSTQDVALTAIADANGDAVATLRPIARQTWTIQQVSIDAPDAGANARGKLYRDGLVISPFVARSDVISGEPYIVLRGSQQLRVVWSGATTGAHCDALVIYDDGR